MRIQMPSERPQDIVTVDAHNKTQLASGLGSGGDGIDRVVWVACFKSQHFKGTPAKHALCRAQTRLPPIRLYDGSIGAAVHFTIGQDAANRIR